MQPIFFDTVGGNDVSCQLRKVQATLRFARGQVAWILCVFHFLATFAVWTFVCHCLNAVSPSYIQLLTSGVYTCVYYIYRGGAYIYDIRLLWCWRASRFTMMFEFVPIHGRPSYLYMHKPAIVVLWSADEPRTRHTKSCDCIESRIFIGSQHRPNKFQ